MPCLHARIAIGSIKIDLLLIENILAVTNAIISLKDSASTLLPKAGNS